MSKLFNRIVKVRVGKPGEQGQEWSGLNITFDVVKTARRGSNKGTIKIFNLSQDSIGFIEQDGNIVELIAGYEKSAALIFAGNIAKRGVVTVKEGVNTITTIEAGEAELTLRETRSDLSFGAGVRSDEILSAIADAMGVGVGNSADLTHQEYLSGFVHVGMARDLLDQVTDDLGVRWSIQNNQLQFLGLEETTQDTAVKLSTTSGMIGSPSRTKDGIEVISLLQPDIFPGRKVQVESRTINGFYKATEIQHTGESRANSFFTKIKAKAIKA